MRITNLAIKNRTAILVLTGLLVVGGLLSYISIPKESSPQIEFAMIVVTTIYPGASPNDIESIITQKIEQEVAVVTGIDNIRSTSTEGVSTVVIEFTPDKDVAEAAREVREKVDLAKPDFPSDVEDPIVSDIDFSEFPILSVNLMSSGSLSRLRDTAEDLQDVLDGVDGVLEVDLVGGLEREVQVNVDIARLQGYGLSISDVVVAIQTENANIPGGSIDIGSENYLVRIDGEFDDPSQIENLVVSSPGGRSIYVRDIGEVSFGFKDRASYARLALLQNETEPGEFSRIDSPETVEDLQVIRLDVKKRVGENIIQTVGRVNEALAVFPFPSGTTYTVTGDQSEQVVTLIADLENNIIAAIIFVVLVLLFFLGIRNATLVGIAIPLSMFLSFLIFQVMGQTLNFIILFSLIIALGMMVDNAVVIVENIYRFREEGHSRWDAARLAVEEVGMAVAASTATTVAVFVPMMFWPGMIGKFMSYMPLTLIVTLSSSLFVALVINPVITGFLVRLESENEKKEKSQRMKIVSYTLVAFFALIIAIANWKTLVFLGIAVPLLVLLYRRVLAPANRNFANNIVPAMTKSYREFLDWMLQRKSVDKSDVFQNPSTFLWMGLLSLVGLGVLMSGMNPDLAASNPQIAQMLPLVGLGFLLAAVVISLRSITNSMFRNTAALGSFTTGFVLLIVGLFFSGIGPTPYEQPLVYFVVLMTLLAIPFVLIGRMMHGWHRIFAFGLAGLLVLSGIGQGVGALSNAEMREGLQAMPMSIAAMIIITPAMILLLLGVVSILVHTFESAYLGRMTSIKAGSVFLGIVVALLLVLTVSGTDLSLKDEVIPMILFPGSIILAGFLGTILAKDRTEIFLTDNRARLLTGTLGALFGIFFLFGAAPTGVEFFPTTDPNLVQITAEAPLGTNLEESNRVASDIYQRVSSLLMNDEAANANTKDIQTGVGVGGDMMFGGGAASPERSTVTLNMVDFSARREPSSETMRKIREEIAGIPGIDIQVIQDQNGPPTGAPINIEVSGQSFDQIVEIADELKSRLIEASETSAVPGIVDIRDNLNSGRPEFQVIVDRDRAAQFGLSTQQIASTVRSAVNGIEASTWRDGKDEYDITVRLEEADRANLESLQSLTILHEGTQIPLVSVAHVEIGSGLGSVTRLDQERVVTVMGDVAPGVNAAAALQMVQAHLAEYVESVPPGYEVTYTGESEDMDESFSFLFTALMIGVTLITMILIAQFNSVKNPFIIMVAVGLSLIGVMLGLILTRTPFGLMTFIGLISLAGIVVNNAIVLVDYIEQLRDKGISKHDAILDGGATRLRPVLLTAFTTVIGLIPLTFGINIDFMGMITNLDPNFQLGSENTQFWGPMGIAIISGLTFATFLTLVIVPVMYSTFDSLAMRFASMRGKAAETEELTPAVEVA